MTDDFPHKHQRVDLKQQREWQKGSRIHIDYATVLLHEWL